MLKGVTTVDHFFAQYLTYIVLAALSVGLIICVRIAVRAWCDAVKLDQEERTFSEQLLSPIVTHLAPRRDIDIRTLRVRLQRAGWRDDNALDRFIMVRAMALLIGASLGVTLCLLQGSLLQGLMLGAALTYLGSKAPDIWLDMLTRGRQERIARILPSVVDLMVLCLDVGLSVEAAFERVTKEVRAMEALMAEEAQLMSNEMSAGVTFPQALKRMADRIGLEELMTLARLISQASALGASVTQALREYSEASFTKRMLSLEEQAGKIAAWLVLPLTLCLLPAVLISVVAPGVVASVYSLGGK